VITNVNSVNADELYEYETVAEKPSENQIFVADQIEWGQEFTFTSESLVPEYIRNHPDTFNYHSVTQDTNTKYYVNIPVLEEIGTFSSTEHNEVSGQRLFTLSTTIHHVTNYYMVMTTEDYNKGMGTDLTTKDGFVYLHGVGNSLELTVEVAK